MGRFQVAALLLGLQPQARAADGAAAPPRHVAQGTGDIAPVPHHADDPGGWKIGQDPGDVPKVLRRLLADEGLAADLAAGFQHGPEHRRSIEGPGDAVRQRRDHRLWLQAQLGQPPPTA